MREVEKQQSREIELRRSASEGSGDQGAQRRPHEVLDGSMVILPPPFDGQQHQIPSAQVILAEGLKAFRRPRNEA
jgi:hypothetical protein